MRGGGKEGRRWGDEGRKEGGRKEGTHELTIE